MEEVGRTPLKKELLSSDDVFLLDADNEIYMWVGKGKTVNTLKHRVTMVTAANKEERKESMIYATKYIANKKKPENTPIIR